MTSVVESGPIWSSLTSRVDDDDRVAAVDLEHGLVAGVPLEVDTVVREVVRLRHRSSWVAVRAEPTLTAIGTRPGGAVRQRAGGTRTNGGNRQRGHDPMRIVVNGQQAFGADVLKALLERGEEVVAVYCAPDKEGRPPDPLAEAAREAGIELRQPESFETDEAAARARRARARPHGHGVRDPQGPRAGPERPDARHDPVPPVAPAAPPRAERDQLGDHPGRRHDRRLDLLARRRPRHRAAALDQGGRDHPGRHAREPVLRQALSDRGRRADRGRRPRPRRQARPSASRTTTTRPTAERPDARDDPVPPVAAARAIAGRARSTGRSSTATRRPASRSSGPTTGSTPARC